jgi:hypothetical protein
MSTFRRVVTLLVISLLVLAGLDRLTAIARAQSNRTPPAPGGAFYPPYRPIGPPPFCDRANPPPPGGAFTAGSGAARGEGARARGRNADPPAAATPPAERDESSRFASAWSMLKNYANARPMACREVTPRCDAVLDEFSSLMTAEQLLDVASFANRCDATPTARRALQIVIDRFPGTSHATLAEAQQRRLPRR